MSASRTTRPAFLFRDCIAASRAGPAIRAASRHGYLISAAAVNLETNTMFAALASLAFLGVAGSMAIRLLHSRIVFWDKGSAAQTAATE